MTYFSNSSAAGWLQCRRAQYYQVLIRTYQRQADIWPDSRHRHTDSVECRVYMRGHRALNRELQHCYFTAGCRQQLFTLSMMTQGLSFEVSITNYC